MLTATGAVLTSDIDKIINQTQHMTDDEFITYMTHSFNLYVSNPSQCGIITGIEE